MRYYLLLTLVSGAAFAFASLAAALLTSALWPLINRWSSALMAGARAHVVAAARLAPVTVGVMAAIVIAAGFLRFEPEDTAEAPGIVLALGAALALGMCLIAALRTARELRTSAECSRLLRVGGRTISRSDGTRIWIFDSQYPVAAVIGVFRTRLLLSTRVIDECTERELDAIVRHERAHVGRRDNVVRAAMLCLPDPLSIFGAARAMEDAWAAAAEEAADDVAGGETSERRTVLAAALVRVARMATTPLPEWVGGLAFYGGHNLEKRVRRLLDTGSNSADLGMSGNLTFAAVVITCGLLLTETSAQYLHAWMEVAVRIVP